MNAGIVRASLAVLEQAWGIPEGHRIERIQYDIEDSYSRTVKLLVTGPLLPEVVEGNPVPWVEPVIEDGQMKFRW